MASTSLITRPARAGRHRAAALLAVVLTPAASAAPACRGTIYLTFDTGSQSQAELVADTLRRHRAKATFFLASEKTVRGDHALDPSWAPYWKMLRDEGHAFGSHTFDHVYALRDLGQGRMEVRPQFGPQAGKKLAWTAADYCHELRRVDQRFRELTGAALDPFWRAPGGKLTPATLAAGQACGYAHVGWSPAGFRAMNYPATRSRMRHC